MGIRVSMLWNIEVIFVEAGYYPPIHYRLIKE